MLSKHDFAVMAGVPLHADGVIVPFHSHSHVNIFQG